MKQKLTKLNMSKVNENNFQYLTIQYNNLCLKELQHMLKNLRLIKKRI